MTKLNKPPRDEQQLEQYIGTLLSRQPLRQAPSSLEARVLRELAVRASKPWWLQGFSRWPWAARVLCLPVGLGLVQLSFLTTGRLMSLWQALQTSAPASTAQSGLQMLGNLSQAVQTLGNMLTREIPQVWIYGAAGLALLLYAALFGLGAAAFRTLLATSEPVRYPT
jgi:hypothetical protein